MGKEKLQIVCDTGLRHKDLAKARAKLRRELHPAYAKTLRSRKVVKDGKRRYELYYTIHIAGTVWHLGRMPKHWKSSKGVRRLIQKRSKLSFDTLMNRGLVRHIRVIDKTKPSVILTAKGLRVLQRKR